MISLEVDTPMQTCRRCCKRLTCKQGKTSNDTCGNVWKHAWGRFVSKAQQHAGVVHNDRPSATAPVTCYTTTMARCEITWIEQAVSMHYCIGQSSSSSSDASNNRYAWKLQDTAGLYRKIEGHINNNRKTILVVKTRLNLSVVQ